MSTDLSTPSCIVTFAPVGNPLARYLLSSKPSPRKYCVASVGP